MRFLLFAIFFFPYAVNAQVLPSFGDSRTATTGWQFLKLNPDPAAAGMGETFIAVTDKVASLYWNPAGLTALDSNSLHITAAYTDYSASTSLSFAGVAYRLGPNTLIGIGMQYFDAGEMDVTTEFQPFGTGQVFGATDLGLGITLARELTDAFSFGITAKYVREDFAGVYTQNAVFDFGFQYDIGIADTRFAVGLQNFGFNTTPSGEIAHEGLIDSVVVSDFNEIAVPTVFRLGIAWDAIKNERNILTVAGQLNHPTDNNETYSIGLEYGWKEIFFARTGYIFASDQAAFPSFGFGLQLKRYFGTLNIDYGFNYLYNLGMVHRIGFGLTL